MRLTPRELIIRLREPYCDCCPIYNECNANEEDSDTCLLLAEAADCIETLIQKGNSL